MLLPAHFLHCVALTIFFLPVLTFVILFFTGKHISTSWRSWLATSVVGLMFILSLYVHLSVDTPLIARWSWFSMGTLHMTSGMVLSSFTTSMLVVVTAIALMVHLYSMEYMKDRRNHSKYFPYLALFISAMIGIILSDSLFNIFIFWELVGLASYLLIGFWYQKKEAAAAAKKAFLYNKAADTAFVIALGLIFTYYGTTELTLLRTLISSSSILVPTGIAISIAVLLVLSTFGKSAQFPFYVWLPDAMEGPTPVSALLHAATMVAAGILVLIKCDFLLVEQMRWVLVWTGAITALLAAIQAIRCYDSKKILAFSTVSQIGYMMMAIGTGNTSAAYFHLGTHAFFKAGLFLSVGAVIHTMHHIQQNSFKNKIYLEVDTLDIRLMGGFRKTMPIAFYAYVACYAALIGIPFFTGFLSKETILASLLQNPTYSIPFGMALTTVGITAYYMTRQLYWMFLGDFRLAALYPSCKEEQRKIKENHWLINIPLIVLACTTLSFFVSFHPFHASDIHWMKAPLPIVEGSTSIYVPIASISITLIGVLLAWNMASKEQLYNWKQYWFWSFVQQNYGIEKAVQFVFITPSFLIARGLTYLDKIIDMWVNAQAYLAVLLAHIVYAIDRFLIEGVLKGIVFLIRIVGSSFRSLIQGQVQSYISTTLIVLALMFWWYLRQLH